MTKKIIGSIASGVIVLLAIVLWGGYMWGKSNGGTGQTVYTNAPVSLSSNEVATLVATEVEKVRALIMLIPTNLVSTNITTTITGAPPQITVLTTNLITIYTNAASATTGTNTATPGTSPQAGSITFNPVLNNQLVLGINPTNLAGLIPQTPAQLQQTINLSSVAPASAGALQSGVPPWVGNPNWVPPIPIYQDHDEIKCPYGCIHQYRRWLYEQQRRGIKNP